MERWSGRVAMVTGASAGIGAAIARELVLKGMKVVGLARRVDRVEALKEELSAAPGQLHPMRCDVTSEADILAAFDWVDKNLGGVDVMVNNAGIGRIDGSAIGSSTTTMQDIFAVNVMGLSMCTREAVKSMRARGVDDGHIIHINSVAGHKIINFPGIAIYTASKHAVTALTESLRMELVALKSRIRVTSISPGMVNTEIFASSGYEGSGEDLLKAHPHLEAKDIADALVYVLGAPAHVQVHELTIKPVGEAS